MIGLYGFDPILSEKSGIDGGVEKREGGMPEREHWAVQEQTKES